MSSSELSHVSPAQLAENQAPQSELGRIISGVMTQGVSAENVSVIKELMAMKEREDARRAEREFATAFVALQADMPKVEATKAVPNNDKTIRYKFAPYEDIMDKVKPVLMRHGFTLSFSMSFDEARVIQECTLQHIGGHSRKNRFMARIGGGPPGSSDSQKDGAASTYAKRFALCDALNIVIEHDTDGKDDGRHEGKPITEDEAAYLRELVKETGTDVTKFLKTAGAKTFEEIGATKYSLCVAALKMRKS